MYIQDSLQKIDLFRTVKTVLSILKVVLISTYAIDTILTDI